MHDPQHQQGGKGVIEDGPVGAVEFGGGGDDEGDGHVFDEVGVGAVFELERVGFGAGGRRRELLADVFFVLHAVVGDPVGEVEEVGGEGEGPGAGYGWEGRGVSGGRGGGVVGLLTEQARDWDAESEVGAHCCNELCLPLFFFLTIDCLFGGKDDNGGRSECCQTLLESPGKRGSYQMTATGFRISWR